MDHPGHKEHGKHKPAGIEGGEILCHQDIGKKGHCRRPQLDQCSVPGGQPRDLLVEEDDRRIRNSGPKAEEYAGQAGKRPTPAPPKPVPFRTPPPRHTAPFLRSVPHGGKWGLSGSQTRGPYSSRRWPPTLRCTGRPQTAGSSLRPAKRRTGTAELHSFSAPPPQAALPAQAQSQQEQHADQPPGEGDHAGWIWDIPSHDPNGPEHTHREDQFPPIRYLPIHVPRPALPRPRLSHRERGLRRFLPEKLIISSRTSSVKRSPPHFSTQIRVDSICCPPRSFSDRTRFSGTASAPEPADPGRKWV